MVEDLHIEARLQELVARGGEAEVPAALLRHRRLHQTRFLTCLEAHQTMLGF